jgi:hypothetical protein
MPIMMILLNRPADGGSGEQAGRGEELMKPLLPRSSCQLRLTEIFALAIATLGCGGCYDAHALVDQVRTDALRNSFHEVDLGTYRTTMPRDPKTTLLMDMELHLFATVPQYKIRAIEERLETGSYQLRSETLSAIRETSGDELAEPDLTHLRGRLTQVVNKILVDAPLKTIGIQDITIVYE